MYLLHLRVLQAVFNNEVIKKLVDSPCPVAIAQNDSGLLTAHVPCSSSGFVDDQTFLF